MIRILGLAGLIFFATSVIAAANDESDSVHRIHPGQNPQSVFDKASPGDKIVFLPGLHEHPIHKHQAILYVDKPIDIELMEGAILRLADGQTVLESVPEITIDHGAVKSLNDLSVGGTFDKESGSATVTIKIDSEGSNGRPDTFSWNIGGAEHRNVPITSGWQLLDKGVEVKFDSASGHSLASFWVVSYDGRESYGIRVGHGLQEDYIEDVRIFGRGTIDLNHQNNTQPSGWVKNISACVLLHGRVRNISVEGISMINSMRSVMAYGEHTGKFLQGGGTEGGDSFDAEKIWIIGTRTINPVDSGYLIGHPSHRGLISNVRCNYNYMETGRTSLEPNFNLNQYEVIGNVIKSGGRAIHCWRKSSNGIIKNNVRIDDATGLEVVMANSPSAWEDPKNLLIRDNRNHLSDALGSWASVTAGMENHAPGAYSAVTGGRRNEADAPFSRVHGLEARSLRSGEDALAAGAFEEPGDAQASRLVVRALTTDSLPHALHAVEGGVIHIAKNSTVGYSAEVITRNQSGSVRAGFVVKGLAQRDAESNIKLFGNTVSTVHSSHPGLKFEALADPKGEALELLATGLTETTLRWIARVELIEIAFE